MKSQRFVLAKPLECGLSLSIDLAPGGDAAKGLKRVAAGYDLEWGTLGIGEFQARNVSHDRAKREVQQRCVRPLAHEASRMTNATA